MLDLRHRSKKLGTPGEGWGEGLLECSSYFSFEMTIKALTLSLSRSTGRGENIWHGEILSP
jgi:hypothetical protein